MRIRMKKSCTYFDLSFLSLGRLGDGGERSIFGCLGAEGGGSMSIDLSSMLSRKPSLTKNPPCRVLRVGATISSTASESSMKES